MRIASGRPGGNGPLWDSINDLSKPWSEAEQIIAQMNANNSGQAGEAIRARRLLESKNFSGTCKIKGEK